MPVRVEDLANARPPGVREGSIASQALAFLRANEGLAYTLKELSQELDVPATTLSPQLTRLRQRGYVAHVSGHWHALDEREVAKAAAMRAATRGANERLGPENPKDWVDTAQD